MQAIQKSDSKVQATTTLALARCLNDPECRVQFASKTENVARIIELLKARDTTVNRNAALALSNSFEYEPIAQSACQLGAIEAIISLITDSRRNCSKFATDALENLLDHCMLHSILFCIALAAKYWLSNKLSKTNVITDGFFDIGSVGGNVASMKPFPSLESLIAAPVDKKREILLIDAKSDTALAALVTLVGDAMPSRKPLEQIQFIAQTVTTALGGCVKDASKTANIGFKVHITSLKLDQKSNVVPIGTLSHGTFYHRALLFKTLCDKVGLSPVSLVRGEYNRGWNEIELTKISVVAPPSAAEEGTTSKPRSGRSRTSAVTEKIKVEEVPEFDPRPYGALDAEVCEGDGPKIGIVDLMYEPGRILGIGGPEAREYMKAS